VTRACIRSIARACTGVALVAGVLATVPAGAAQGDIITVAGTGAAGFGGDGSPATAASLDSPMGVAIDESQNLYVADWLNHRVRRVDASGTITTFAGSGAARGDVGENGPATSAALAGPWGVATGPGGTVYIADWAGARVLRVDAAGTITTFAGTGDGTPQEDSGDGGPATAAFLMLPTDVIADAAGNVFISEGESGRVRRVDPAGTITTVASGLRFPSGLGLDPAGGLLISDHGGARVYRLTETGMLTVVAGTGVLGHDGDGGPATAAALTPWDVVADAAGTIYLSDSEGNGPEDMVSRVRMVSTTGVITTVAGTGSCGPAKDGGPGTSAAVCAAAGLALGPAGLAISEGYGHRVRLLSVDQPAPTTTSSTSSSSTTTSSTTTPTTTPSTTTTSSTSTTVPATTTTTTTAPATTTTVPATTTTTRPPDCILASITVTSVLSMCVP
jgi:trimeric autotransporter adhesin